MRGLLYRRWAAAAFLCIWAGGSGCRSFQNPPPPQDGGFVAQSLSEESTQRAQTFAWLATAQHFEQTDDYAQALEAYTRALEYAPDNEKLTLQAATILLKMQRHREAVESAEAFLAKHPDAEPTLFWLASFYTQTEEYSRATNLLTRLTVLNPAEERYWGQLVYSTSCIYSNAAPESQPSIETLLQQAIAAASPNQGLRSLLVSHYLHHIDTLDPFTQNGEIQSFILKTIEQLERISEDDPGNVMVKRYLGELWLRADRPDKAIESYQQALLLQPDDSEILDDMASAKLQAGDIPGAIETLREQDSNSVNECLRVARLYLQAGDMEKAAMEFQRATEVDPTSPGAWLEWAALQSETNDEQAIRTLRTALTHLPNHSRILEILAILQMRQNRYSKAADLFQQAWEAHRADSEALPLTDTFYYNAALTATRLRRLDDAAHWLKLGMELNPDLPAAYAVYAANLTADIPDSVRGGSISVLRRLEEATNHENASLPILRGGLYLEQNRPKLAVRAFREALDIMERFPLEAANNLTPFFYFTYGAALDLTGQTDEAIAQLEKCLELDPLYSDALNYLAYTWAVQGIRLDEALHHIQIAIAAKPDNPAYLDTLGWVLFKRQDYPGALEYLQKADQLQPDDPEITGHLQQVRQKLGLADPSAEQPKPDSGELLPAQENDTEAAAPSTSPKDGEPPVLDTPLNISE